MRLDTSKISEIENLAKHGESLNKISKRLGIKKTTVYYHFRKFKGKTIIKPKFNFNSDEELGEVIGIFAGDGSYYFDPKRYNYQIRIHFGIMNIRYMKYVKNILGRGFGKNFNDKKDGPNKIILEICSKDIANFFFRYLNFESSDKSKTVCLKSSFLEKRRFVIGFLRGLLDTDGTICICKTGMRIAFYTSSQQLSIQISKSLGHLNIQHGISSSRSRQNQYNVYILSGDNDKIKKILFPFKGR